MISIKTGFRWEANGHPVQSCQQHNFLFHRKRHQSWKLASRLNELLFQPALSTPHVKALNQKKSCMGLPRSV